MIIVVSNINRIAVGWIDDESDIASKALLAQDAVKVEFCILRHAHSWLSIYGIQQVGEWLGSCATAVVPQYDDVSGAFSCIVVERTP